MIKMRAPRSEVERGIGPFSDRTVDSHVKKLRKKIADVLHDREIVHSMYGVGTSTSGKPAPLRGYRFAAARARTRRALPFNAGSPPDEAGRFPMTAVCFIPSLMYFRIRSFLLVRPSKASTRSFSSTSGLMYTVRRTRFWWVAIGTLLGL